MSYTNKRSTLTLDWVTISIFFAIVFIGWLMLYTVSYPVSSGWWFDFNSIVGRQTIWIFVSIICFIIFTTLDWRIWSSLAYPVYIFTTSLLLLVLIFGREINGATSWFSIMGFSIQPSEFAKIGTALGVAAYLGQPNINLNNIGNVFITSGIVLIPAFLIFLQPDAGTALIFASFLVPMYRAGLNSLLYLLAFSVAFIFIGSLIWSPLVMLIIIILATYLILIYNSKDNRLPLSLLLLLTLFIAASYSHIDYRYILLILLGVGIYFAYIAYREAKYNFIIVTAVVSLFSMLLSFGTDWAFNNVLKHHQRERINVWLRPELCDPHGSLYNIIQSKTAIGSGGITGRGFLQGNMTKLNYVPEQSTDFIFTILGEEQGFLGSASLIILFLVLLFRLTVIAERANIPFIRYFAYSIAGILFFHFFINIGMTIGLMPVIGIPLPLMSKGGSSIVAFSIMFAILLKMDKSRQR